MSHRPLNLLTEFEGADETPPLSRANSSDSGTSSEMPEPPEIAAEGTRVSSPVEYIQIASPIGDEQELSVLERIEDTVDLVPNAGGKGKDRRSASRRFSRLEIICDNSDEVFGENANANGNPEENVELTSRSIDYLVDEPESREPEVLQYRPRGKLNPVISGVPRRRTRKALLIGIQNAPGYQYLRGPHADVDIVRNLLTETYGWRNEAFMVLRDHPNSLLQPTADNMRMAIHELVRDARAGDQLFFYFAGHATQIQDYDGDETDGMDEVLVACDGRGIVDDELHDILVKRVPHGCTLTALFDCCSSGTSLDLPYNEYTSWPVRPPLAPGRLKRSDGHVVLLSACEDSEKAYEGRHRDGRSTGVFTEEVVTFLRQYKHSSFRDILTFMSQRFQAKRLNQHPQISSSRVIDLQASLAL